LRTASLEESVKLHLFRRLESSCLIQPAGKLESRLVVFRRQ
jgi:hypothetical protein